MRISGLCAGALVLLCAPTESLASGYLTARFGSDQGTPAMPNPYAIYFNPAALGPVTGTKLTADLTIALRSVSYRRPVSALSYQPGDAEYSLPYASGNTGKNSLLDPILLPFLGVSSDLGLRSLRVGFASYIPFGGQAAWKKRSAWDSRPDAPGNSDGPQRWHNITGQLLSWYNTAAVAYVFPDSRFTVGASLSLIYSSVQTIRARNVDDSDGIAVEGRSLVDAHGFQGGAALGVHWEPFADHSLKLGLSYTSQPGFGEMKLKGTLQTAFPSSPPQSQSIDFHQTFPDVVRLGGAYRVLEDLELRSDVEYVRWSVFKSQCVVQAGEPCTIAADGSSPTSAVVLNVIRNWKDAVTVRAGAGYFASDRLELFGSVGLGTSAVPKETMDASTIDSTTLYGTLGARIGVSDRVGLGVSYNHIYYVPVETQGQTVAYVHPSKSPSAAGKYQSQVGFLNANVTVDF